MHFFLFFQDGEAKQVCVKTESTFSLDQGKLGNCGGSCCIFYKDV